MFDTISIYITVHINNNIFTSCSIMISMMASDYAEKHILI